MSHNTDNLYPSIKNEKTHQPEEQEIEVDLQNFNQAHLCEHEFEDGALCQMVAPSGEHFCRWHATAADRLERRYKYEKRRSKTAIKELIIPSIEDQYSLQLAIHEVMDAIIDGRADSRRAGHLLYALQISQNNIRKHFYFPRVRLTEGLLETCLEEQLEQERKAQRERGAMGKKPPQSISIASVIKEDTKA
jgi:hypothetical protein